MLKHKKTNLFTVLVTAAVLTLMTTGCRHEKGSSRDFRKSAPVHVNVKISVDSVRIPGKVTLTIVAIAKDFSVDTLVSFTNPNETASMPQILSRNYTFKPLQELKAIATLLDAGDHILQKDSAIPGMLYPGDTVNVSLTLSTLYCMYQAALPVIPDSISSTKEPSKQVLHLNRLVMKVDDRVTVDSSTASGSYLKPLTKAMLYYDHMTMGKHAVELLAYGPMDSWDVSKPLFSGSATFNVTQNLDPTTPITLSWVGPPTVVDSLSTEVGKTDKVFFINSLTNSPTP